MIPFDSYIFSRDIKTHAIFLLLFIAKDKLKKPKLLKSVACTVEHVTLQLNPTIEKFEEELCETLQEDRLNMMGKRSDGTSMAIMERRLLVGLYIYSLLCSLKGINYMVHFFGKGNAWQL